MVPNMYKALKSVSHTFNASTESLVQEEVGMKSLKHFQSIRLISQGVKLCSS